MPIYEYKCSDCGFQKEFLQKISDPLLTTCTECGKATFLKMLTAAGFQLKGSGWYATDFKHSGSKPAEKKEGEKAGKSEGAGDSTKGEAASEGGSTAKSAETTSTSTAATKTDSAASTPSTPSSPATST